MNTLFISPLSPEEFIKTHKKGILNFINANTLWWSIKSDYYFNSISKKVNINFIDSKVLSFLLRKKQNRGPSFTSAFLSSERDKSSNHFFIGLDSNKRKALSEKINIPLNRIFSYNPSFVEGLEFSNIERKKIVSLIRKSKSSFVWVCVGSPKQEVLSNQLFSEYPKIYLNVGAALDFLLGRKKEAPLFFQKTGLEWFYRLVTDFKYSKKKVWRSFVGVLFLILRKVRLRSKE